jgi:hypothetical protein
MRDKVKKNLDSLKDDLQTLNKSDMDKIVGGKSNTKWNLGCDGIVPQ